MVYWHAAYKCIEGDTNHPGIVANRTYPLTLYMLIVKVKYFEYSF